MTGYPRMEDPCQEIGWKPEGVELCLSEAWEGKNHALNVLCGITEADPVIGWASPW